jgi:hypothetical protein
MAVLSYAYEHDIHNNWFCLLTESCVPIISPEKFRKLFFANSFSSIMKWKPAYWNINIHRRANLRLLTKEYWLANDPWFTLCRAHIQKCILFMFVKPNIYKQINNGGLANESMFAIILQTFHELTDTQYLINESSTISDWTRMSSPTSPYLFENGSDENMLIISNLLKENKYAMFLRKVHPLFPDEKLNEIMNMDFKHTYLTTRSSNATNYNYAKNKEHLLVYMYKISGLLFVFYCCYYLFGYFTF